jgi:hypothetical protein
MSLTEDAPASDIDGPAVSARSPLARAHYRVKQFVAYLRNAERDAVDAELRALLSPPEWRLLARLTPADRWHALRMRRWLEEQGWSDPDLLRAALLHDAGKADDDGRVYLAHRVAAVLLAASAPGLLRRLAVRSGGFVRHGLYLATEHPRIGAEQAREAGATERVCWFILHHHDGTILSDPELRALRQADNE